MSNCLGDNKTSIIMSNTGIRYYVIGYNSDLSPSVLVINSEDQKSSFSYCANNIHINDHSDYNHDGISCSNAPISKHLTKIKKYSYWLKKFNCQ